MELWNQIHEINFFKEALKNFAPPEKVFYKLPQGYFAYVPKDEITTGQTLQSRNSLIGQFTEKWCRDILQPIANSFKLYAINGVICPEIGLTQSSSADLAFCQTDQIIQSPKSIKLIFEIKMSVVNNYKFIPPDTILYCGDYRHHRGNPSLLRSDSMLKAIGKAINIRTFGLGAHHIPIVVIGNSPISKNYVEKVDFLKKSGVIQAFWSLNPKPLENEEFIKKTDGNGFYTISSIEELKEKCEELVESDMYFFSSMIPKSHLGELIATCALERDDISRANKFLSLLNEIF